MKKFTKIFVAVAALSLLFSSCVREKIEVGEPENDSYGVYFETLSPAQSSFELDPAEEAVLTFKAFRQKKDGDITVPLKLTATIETEEGIEEVKTIFAVGELFFEDGQEESEFKVEFPNALMGTTYSVAVECTDREYVHIYSDKPTSVAFEVTRVKWNLVKGEKGEEYGSWTDDIISSAFGIPGKYAVNDKIQIYEREDNRATIVFLMSTTLICLRNFLEDSILKKSLRRIVLRELSPTSMPLTRTRCIFHIRQQVQHSVTMVMLKLQPSVLRLVSLREMFMAV